MILSRCLFHLLELMDIVKSRLRPFEDIRPSVPSERISWLEASNLNSLSLLLKAKENLFFIEAVPPAAIFARLFIHKESGVLDLIVNKETRTLILKRRFDFSETLSKKRRHR